MDMRLRVLGLLVPFAFFGPPKLPVQRIALGTFSLALGETSFADVATRFGLASIVHTGDAGGSRYQACYRSPERDQPTYYLESDEMGSGERITQFEAIAQGARTAAEDSVLAHPCHLLTSRLRVRTDRGVALGISRQAIERRLGGPGRDSAGVVIYSGSEIRRAMGVRATAWSVLRLRYSGDRVVAFAAAAGIAD